MALTELIFGSPKQASIGLVQADASVNERHTKRSEKTSFPVEEGANISDHVRRLPEQIEMRIIVTNTPIVVLASLRAPSPLINDLTTTNERAELAYAELRRVQDAGERVEVITTLREYENMIITSTVCERNARNGNIVDIVVQLEELITAQTQEIVVELESESAGVVDTGKKPPKTPSPPAEAAAASQDSLFAGFAGGFG